LIRAGWVEVDGHVCSDPAQTFEPQGAVLSVQGQAWPYHAKALIMMHKPAGVECSQKPKHHPSVYSLLPAPLRRRDVQSIGRLDADTTGLLLFTDDGALIHRLTSPKKHVPKVYEVQCNAALDDVQLEKLLAGVVLEGEHLTVRAVACEKVTENHLRMTLTDGKYHQVKRMLAAVGNHVVSLHRSGFGHLQLPVDLMPGQWCWLNSMD
jgi:16S rRNA pseudouridine516 synthase